MAFPPIKKPGMVGEFLAFIAQGNVIDLAVGIIIGAAFTSIVGSLVKDLITPLIGLATGGVDFSNIFLTLKGPANLATLDAAKAAGAVTLNFGLFLNAVINFIIIAFVIFMMVKLLSVFKRKKAAEPEAPPAPTATETLLTEIRDQLVRQNAARA